MNRDVVRSLAEQAIKRKFMTPGCQSDPAALRPSRAVRRNRDTARGNHRSFRHQYRDPSGSRKAVREGPVVRVRNSVEYPGLRVSRQTCRGSASRTEGRASW